MENITNRAPIGGGGPEYRSAFAPVGLKQEQLWEWHSPITSAMTPLSREQSENLFSSNENVDILSCEPYEKETSIRLGESVGMKLGMAPNPSLDVTVSDKSNTHCVIPKEHLGRGLRDNYDDTTIPYDTGIITEPEEEDDSEAIEILSCYPLDQCSRTSPSNHATIRRWKQRSCRMTASGGKATSSSIVDLRIPKIFNEQSKLRKTLKESIKIDPQRTSHLSGPVKVNTNLCSPSKSLPLGPLSAPSKFHWDSPSSPCLPSSVSPVLFSSSRANSPRLPQANSTPVQASAIRQSLKLPFNISNIVGSQTQVPDTTVLPDDTLANKTVFDQTKEANEAYQHPEASLFQSNKKTQEHIELPDKTKNIIQTLDKLPKNVSKGSHSIPVGIAVARQRETPRLPAGAKGQQNQIKIPPSTTFSLSDQANASSTSSQPINSLSSTPTSQGQNSYNFITPSPVSSPFSSYTNSPVTSNLTQFPPPDRNSSGSFLGSPYSYLGSPTLPPWTPYSSPYFPPDYLLLQQQMMLLHQLQKAHGSQPVSSINMGSLQELGLASPLLSGSYGMGGQPNMIPSLSNVTMLPWSPHLDFGQSLENKSDQSLKNTSEYSSNSSSFHNVSDLTGENESKAVAFNLSLNTDDSGLELSTESNNNVTKDNKVTGDKLSNCLVNCDNVINEGGENDDISPSQVDSDTISVGSESEYQTFSGESHYNASSVIESNNDCDDAKKSENTKEPSTKSESSKVEKEDINGGLYLLTEGIACMEKRGTMRHLSVDSYHHKKYDSLQMLCDVANQRRYEKTNDALTRASRSKSLDTDPSKHLSSSDCSPDPVSRNHRSPRAEQDIKDFISRKSTTYQNFISTSSDCPDAFNETFKVPSSSQDPEEMDAWELDIRIQMAEKQRKYNEITKKLKRLHKTKSKKDPKRNIKEQKCKMDKPHFKPAEKVIQEKVPEYKKYDSHKETSINQSNDAKQIGSLDKQPKMPCVDKENIGKETTFSDTFQKFKNAYNAKKKVPTLLPNLPESNKLETSTQKKSKHNYSNWASCVLDQKVQIEKPEFKSDLTDVIKKEVEEDKFPAYPNTSSDMLIKREPHINEESIKLEVFDYPHDNKADIESPSKQRNTSDGYYRKKPKIEKYLVSEDILNPVKNKLKANKRKHSHESDCGLNKKKIKKDKRFKYIGNWRKADSAMYSDSQNKDHKEIPTINEDSLLNTKIIKKENTYNYEENKCYDYSSENETNFTGKDMPFIKTEKTYREASNVDDESEHRRQKKLKKKDKIKDDLYYDLKRKKKKKDKKNKKDKDKDRERNRDKHLRDAIKENISQKEYKPQVPKLRSCRLTSSDLSDGLRILKRMGSHFYPGRITEISPPDIYGIVVDRERGNKPHIFSQEEVLKEAILDMKPKKVSELAIGARVCAFWSSKIHYLHPGTVAGPDTVDPNYIIIELDDGDSRDIHVDFIRYLPADYPIVDQECDPIVYLSGSRKRGIGDSNSTTCSPVKEANHNESKKVKSSKSKTKLKTKSNEEWSVVSVTEVSDNTDDLPISISSNKIELSQLPGPDLPVPDRDDDQDSAFVSNGHGGDYSDFEDRESINSQLRRISGNVDKSAITAFLPPQHLLWAWSDPGRKLTNKARKLYHQRVAKEEESLTVGDCAVFLSTGRPDRPYIGRIQSMWESWTGNMKVQVKWFYHAAETEGTAKGGGRVEDIKTPGALFESSHFDENDIQTISHKCEVLQFAEFVRRRGDGSVQIDVEDTDDLYYLAGEYDPVEGSIVFKPDIFTA